MPTYLTRAQWGAKPPKSHIGSFSLPVSRTFLHHTVTTWTADPAADARHVQAIAFGRGYADISYSFLVHPSGVVLEGRGWGKSGAHTLGYNSVSHAFSLIGNYDSAVPPQAAIDAVRWLYAEGVKLGKIRAGSPLDPHRQVFATACPGQHAVSRLPLFRTPWNSPVPGTPTPTPEDDMPVEFLYRLPSDVADVSFVCDLKTQRAHRTAADRDLSILHLAGRGVHYTNPLPPLPLAQAIEYPVENLTPALAALGFVAA